MTELARYIGKVGYSSDGFGKAGDIDVCYSNLSGTISASVPVGSTVIAAYLYTQFFNFSGTITPAVTLNGYPVTFGANVVDPTACCGIGSARSDVTDIVKPVIDGGAGGTYNFDIIENTPECAQTLAGGCGCQGGSRGLNGEALVVVYSLSSLVDSTVIIYDGFAAATGDTAVVNFSSALHPGDAGFFANMIIGSGFSCCGQRSAIQVNGKCLSGNAGNFDDGNNYPTDIANGNLITVGGFNDSASVAYVGTDDATCTGAIPRYNETPDPDQTDHEKYNISSKITDGDTSLSLTTKNASLNDNIFVAVFNISQSLFKCVAE